MEESKESAGKFDQQAERFREELLRDERVLQRRKRRRELMRKKETVEKVLAGEDEEKKDVTAELGVEHEDEDEGNSSDDDDMNTKLGERLGVVLPPTKKRKRDEEDETALDLHEEDVGEERSGEVKFNEKGVPIDPFNLEEEQEGGHFTASGMYVRQKEEGEKDAWLDSVDEVAVASAAAVAAAAREEKKKEEAEEGATTSARNPTQLQYSLVCLLEEDETVKQAIRRLAKSGEQEKFDAASEAAIALMSGGGADIYSETIASLSRNIMASDDVRGCQWDYKWSASASEQFGPHSTAQLLGWRDSGAFAGKDVVLRHHGVSDRAEGAGGSATGGLLDDLADDDDDDDASSAKLTDWTPLTEVALEDYLTHPSG
eukprot:PLAT3690.1.p2 GENE.PLAT3690.1~~PLAT3690.1.p2  ORF type:complete len:398 (-),score=121.33 PLAT3690.1:1570-2688(-)